MLPSAKRLSLVAQAVAILREHIASGSAGDGLPSERVLCVQLGVSRMTLRAALARLTDERLIRSSQGRRHQIIRARPGRQVPAASRTVVILSPIPLPAVDPRVRFWIDELRETLGKDDYQLDFLQQRNGYTRHPEPALEDLVARQRPAVWLLFLSHQPMQQWFSTRGLPAVIPGSRHEGVRLPSVDVDYRATCRHAFGRFLARGHRCLALLNPRSMAAGDVESELGFREAGAAAGAGVETIVAQHDGTVADICHRLDRLLERRQKPTAYLVSRPTHALTTLGHLVRRGMRFPRETALIARDHDSFLEYVIPSIARYQVNPVLFAHKLSRIVRETAAGGNARPRDYRILPQFIPGDTLV